MVSIASNPRLENWTEMDKRKWIGLIRKTYLDPELGYLDLTDKIWIKRKMNPGPETGFKAWKFGFKARTKYGVYSCPSLPFLRIENRAKIKDTYFVREIWILERKH